jgi:hypothetical protein
LFPSQGKIPAFNFALLNKTISTGWGNTITLKQVLLI